ncbi:MAG: hypothetical protein U1E16_03990 [Hyphomicrobiales bacterium]
MSEQQQKYPEPEGFQKTLDDTCDAVVDGIFRSFTESEKEDVRDWAEKHQLLAIRPTLAPVIAHYVRSMESQFYQVGYHVGAATRIAKSGRLGERTIVTKHDANGRITETVKVPMTIEERLDLEKQQAPAA